MPRFSFSIENAIAAAVTVQSQNLAQNPAKKLALILIGLLALRLIALFAAPWGLHGDEAQYWAWSQDPAFGYFSKPPIIAWVIGATTAIFGNAEWAVRLSAPFLHMATTVMIFLAARRFYGAQAGFWAALIYTLMPAVWLSSFIMSTDAALLLYWATALHAWAALRDGGGWGRVVQLGAALGLGLLSKYAMAFMVPVLCLAVLFDAPSRKALLGPKGFVVAGIAAVLLAPNLMWNAANEFATISHTAENANLGRDLFNPEEVIQFWIDQFGVFGIIPFPMLLIALVAAFRGRLTPPAKWLAGLAALPLLAITLEALLSRANANWAVTAYIAAPILVAFWAVQNPRRLDWLKWGLIAQTALVLCIGGIAANEKTVDAVGLNNAVKRLRAWPETAEAVKVRTADADYAFVAADNRLVFYDLNYYGVGEARLAMWSLNASPAHHASLTRALPDTDKPVLILSYHHNFEDYFREDFETLIELEPIIINLGPGKTRHLKVFRGSGYKRTSREDRT
jgi:4-amino-4-deoxy-L-arabinose transferase-like glycosyltransferase